MKNRDEYPENQATAVWEEGEVVFSLIRHPELGHYCGYCRFPKRFLAEQGYGGIVTYVPVHGGITYAGESEDGSMVYGFDCAHAMDDLNPDLVDLEWLKAECRKMANSLKAVIDSEVAYLSAPDNEARAKIIDRYHEVLSEEDIHFDIQDNFGAMLNVMGGDL